MQLFYCKDISPSSFCTLDAEESRHAVRVMRLRAGDVINVTDGCGNLYQCKIVDANDRACSLTPLPLSYDERGVDTTNHSPRLEGEGSGVRLLHIAVAPTKNPARMEWLVEKAVEIGVGEITLLQCDHSERSFLKTDRLEKLAISAMKQSLHTMLPRINPAVKLSDWLTQTFKHSSNKEIKLIAHCEDDKPRTLLSEALKPGMDTVVLIGPEGDFSAKEISLAIESGFLPVSFGTARLRTETAALYAVAAFNFINDRP